MKKIVALALFFSVFTTLQAQVFLGGQISFNSYKDKDESGSSQGESTVNFVTLLPRLGYVFGDFVAGLDVGVTSINSKSPRFGGGVDESKTNLTTVGPFVRYVKKPVENIGIWVEAQAGASFGKRTENGVDDSNLSGFNLGVRPGVIFYIGKHLSFEASFGRLGFQSQTTKDAQNSSDKYTTTTAGLSLNSNVVLDLLGENPTVSSGFLFGVNWTF